MYIYIVSFKVVHMSTYTHAHACTRAKGYIHVCLCIVCVLLINFLMSL